MKPLSLASRTPRGAARSGALALNALAAACAAPAAPPAAPTPTTTPEPVARPATRPEAAPARPAVASISTAKDARSLYGSCVTTC